MLIGVCLLCGLPGAGKTTVAKYLKENTPPGYVFIHICYDKVMPYVDHKKDIKSWKLARTSILQHVEKLLSFVKARATNEDSRILLENESELVSSGLEAVYKEVRSSSHVANFIFIIDDNMQYRGMRHEYHKICCIHSIGFSIIYFDVSLEKCVENNEKRSDPVPASTITKLHSQMELPGGSNKNKWEKHVCCIKEGAVYQPNTCLDDILNVMFESVRDPPAPPLDDNSAQTEDSRQENRRNFIHQADICMRRFVSFHVQSLKNDGDGEKNLRDISQKLNLAKKTVSMLLKSGYVDENEYIDSNNFINVPLIENKIHALMNSELS